MASLREHFTDPQRCWRRFIAGLAIFIVGAGLLFGTAHLSPALLYHPVLYWFSAAVLLTGFALAMSGYLGIFIQRFTGLNPTKKQSRDDGD